MEALIQWLTLAYEYCYYNVPVDVTWLACEEVVMHFLEYSCMYQEGLLQYNYYSPLIGYVGLSKMCLGGLQYYLHLQLKHDDNESYIEASEGTTVYGFYYT